MIENWVQWQDVFNYDPTPQPTERNLSPRPISPINPIKYSTNLQLYESGEEQKATKVNQHHGKENQIKVKSGKFFSHFSSDSHVIFRGQVIQN